MPRGSCRCGSTRCSLSPRGRSREDQGPARHADRGEAAAIRPRGDRILLRQPRGRGGRRARDLQDILGEIHDCDVMLPAVRGHREELQRGDARRSGRGPGRRRTRPAARRPRAASHRLRGLGVSPSTSRPGASCSSTLPRVLAAPGGDRHLERLERAVDGLPHRCARGARRTAKAAERARRRGRGRGARGPAGGGSGRAGPPGP